MQSHGKTVRLGVRFFNKCLRSPSHSQTCPTFFRLFSRNIPTLLLDPSQIPHFSQIIPSLDPRARTVSQHIPSFVWLPHLGDDPIVPYHPASLCEHGGQTKASLAAKLVKHVPLDILDVNVATVEGDSACSCCSLGLETPIKTCHGGFLYCDPQNIVHNMFILLYMILSRIHVFFVWNQREEQHGFRRGRPSEEPRAATAG